MFLGQTQTFTSPSEALQHYGVKGMRWGVRNEDQPGGRKEGSQPVELSAKSQQRAEKFVKRAEILNTKISELRVSNEALKGSKNPAKQYERYANTQALRQFERDKARAIKDAEAVEKGKLTSTQKQVVAGALAIGTLFAATMYLQGKQSGALNSFKLRSLARLRGQKTPFNVNEKLRRAMSPDELLKEVAKPVNPGYADPGGKMNCRRSTYAYELRRRGFDVHATTSSAGWGQSESGVINALTPGSKNFYRSTSVSEVVSKTGMSSVARGDKRLNPLKKIMLTDLNKELQIGSDSSSKRVLAELAKQPNGARGEVLFKFPTFGHSMAYEVVNGVPHIFDSQKGTRYGHDKRVESKWDGFHGAEITRLDNANLDLNFLSRWATNVGDK